MFFSSVIFGDDRLMAEAEAGMVKALGAVRERTGATLFTHSAYYEPEMGPGLSRCFLLFEPLVARERLVEMKHATNAIEQVLAMGGKRRVNIDPGYIALEHVVLGTTKGFAHRVYLGQGIFGDLTLMYANNTYRTLEWTYPDYAGGDIIAMFKRWRETYKKELKCHAA
jgi:hypothetical protein